MLHSRVARSNILAFTRMGCEVTVCGPPTLIPRGIESLGCEVRYTLDELGDGRRGLRAADAARAHDGLVRAVAARVRRAATRSTAAGSGPNQLLMHPGPVNRGVELAAEVIDSPQALIAEQVESGVVVRMAVLYELLAGRGAPNGVREGAETEPQPA